MLKETGMGGAETATAEGGVGGGTVAGATWKRGGAELGNTEQEPSFGCAKALDGC